MSKFPKRLLIGSLIYFSLIELSKISLLSRNEFIDLGFLIFRSFLQNNITILGEQKYKKIILLDEQEYQI